MATLYVAGEQAERLPLYPVTLGTEHNQEARRRPQGAPFHHLFVVQKGTGCFDTPQGRFFLEEGTVAFIHKETPVHYHRQGECFQTGWITFDGPAVDSLSRYFSLPEFTFCQSPALLDRISQYYTLAKRGASPEALSGSLYDLLLSAFREMQTRNRSSHLDTAKAYMQEHCHKSLSVGQIAQATGISPSLLYRLFHDREATTPVAYLQALRIRKAKQLLLQNPKIKIADLAQACGFEDCAYFCKVFKTQEHITPKAFLAKYSL